MNKENPLMNARTLGFALLVALFTALSQPDLAAAQNVTGSGTINRIPKWSPGTTELRDSIITELSGNIGIGITSPVQRLEVNLSGGINQYFATIAADPTIGSLGSGIRLGWGTTSGGPTIRVVHGGDFDTAGIGFSSWSAGANLESLRINPNGNVGIGTSTPGFRLDVAGTANISNTLTQGGGYAYLGSFNTQVRPTAGNALAVSWNYTAGGRDVDLWNTDTANTSGASFVFKQLTGANSHSDLMTILPGGNVGIGTISPGTRLEIFGNYVTNKGSLYVRSNDHAYIVVDKSTAGFQSGILFNSAGAPKWFLYNPGSSEDLRLYDPVGGDRVTFKLGGNVGIGTTNPLQLLHIGTHNLVGGLRVDGPSQPNTPIYSFSMGGLGSFGIDAPNITGGRFVVTEAGKVGIGIFSPIYKLQVQNGRALVAPVGESYALGLSRSEIAGAFWLGVSNNNFDPDLILSSNNGAEKVRVTATGRIGIGTNNPQAQLDVVGDVIVSGNIAAKYQDVAEWVPSSQSIPAGTVVVLDAKKSNHVIASSLPYDTRVAGVISAKPGVLLGEGGEGRVMVATTGRVRVRVDATNGPIRVGDLLVTSDKEGIAMRSQPLDLGGTPIHRPGTLIGKALESLEKGVGEILVLLSLQ